MTPSCPFRLPVTIVAGLFLLNCFSPILADTHPSLTNCSKCIDSFQIFRVDASTDQECSDSWNRPQTHSYPKHSFRTSGYVCPDHNYSLEKIDDGYLCYIIRDSIEPTGANFSDAFELCSFYGDSLPIIPSSDVNSMVGETRHPLYWIGIVCNYETDTWMWSDNQSLSFTAFDEDPGSSCTDSNDRYVFHKEGATGTWRADNADMQIDEDIMCMRNAEPSVPEPTDLCDEGWYLVDGICYLFETDHSRRNWTLADEYCKSLNATLPIILSEEQNQRLYVETEQYMLAYPAQCPFWIGLVCINDDLEWVDGSPYSYSNVMFEDIPCANDPRGFFYNDEFWAPLDKGYLSRITVCSKNVPYPTATEDTTISLPFETTSYAQTTELEFDSTTDATSDHSSTSADTSSSIPSTSNEPTTLTLPTTTSRIDDVSLPVWEIVLIAMGSIAIFGIIISIIICVCRAQNLRAKLIEMRLHDRKKNKVTSHAKSLRYYDLPRKSDEWEIERKFVSIDYMKMLGEGAFGSVYLGRVLAKNIPSGMERSIIELATLEANNDFVAVKLLHETVDALTERDFRTEMEIMKRIGYHERIVNILACITQSEPILLITEHCAKGDLLNFMRQRRKHMLEKPDDLNELHIVTFKQQIMFAIQVAYGLEFLSSRGFVHRDIAARNIMVDHQDSCKIGDFGLCRKIGKEEDNYRAQGGKLPLKWMSPEAIEKYIFSTASDVWSYGILLFEIVTLGGTPYVNWPTSELLIRLQQGDRMERPDNCNESLFDVMSRCWAELPANRPSFGKLRKQLGVLLEDVNQDDYYLKLNAQANYYVLE